MGKQIKILTQNCFLGLPMGRVKRLVKETGADICCLQEVTSRRFLQRASRTGEHAVVASRAERVFRLFPNRNVTLSRWPVTDSGEIRYERLTRRRVNPFAGKVLWVEIKDAGTRVRIYNCHMAVFGLGMEDRASALEDVAKHAKRFSGPVVICGDMNTVMPERRPGWWLVKAWCRFPNPSREVRDYMPRGEKYYFKDMAEKQGFTEMGDIERQTWRLPFVRMNLWRPKLDWMMYRGLSPVEYELGPWIGDHRGIIATLKV